MRSSIIYNNNKIITFNKKDNHHDYYGYIQCSNIPFRSGSLLTHLPEAGRHRGLFLPVCGPPHKHGLVQPIPQYGMCSRSQSLTLTHNPVLSIQQIHTVLKQDVSEVSSSQPVVFHTHTVLSDPFHCTECVRDCKTLL